MEQNTTISMELSLLCISTVLKYIEQDGELTEEELTEARKLDRLGFTRSRNVKRLKERDVLYRFVRTLKQARKDYGERTLLIPERTFLDFCKEKGLVCGTFHAYVGDIPSWAAKEIVGLKPNYYIIKSALDTEIQGYHQFFSDATSHSSDPFDFFICAPSDMMSKFVLSKAEDPMICARTMDGILVLTRWGEEIDSETFRAYERLNDILAGIEAKPMKLIERTKTRSKISSEKLKELLLDTVIPILATILAIIAIILSIVDAFC